GERLMFLGTEQERERLEQVLPQLVTALPPEPRRELRSYRATGVAAAELQRLVTPLATAESDSTAPATVTVDPSGRRLLVFATAAVHEKIDTLIQELNQPIPPEEELILLPYTLEHADASDVQRLLEQAIDGITLIADDSGQQLIATGTLAQHGRIKSLLAELDRPVSENRRVEM